VQKGKKMLGVQGQHGQKRTEQDGILAGPAELAILKTNIPPAGRGMQVGCL
jgi:hypothetical protein